MAERHGAFDRRSFLKTGTLGAAAVAAGLPGASLAMAEPANPVKPVFRTLGRTGMKITAVSIGAMRTEEAGVFRAAFDMGVNYVDTARVYMNGKNEKIVGEALRGYRDKVFVATKVWPGKPEAMKKSIAESLAALGLDHVDLLQLHAISSKNDVLNQEYRDVLAEAKRQGKTRFLGVTTHKNEAEVLAALADDPTGFYDTVLVVYNFQSKPAIAEGIARAAKAGLGVIAMKTQAGGYKTKELGDVSPHQAALKFVLNNPNVAAAVPAMVDLAQLRENLAVMNMKFEPKDAAVLERYRRATAGVYCHRCGACSATCRVGLDIAEINRAVMYADGYGDPALARATYAKLPPARRAAACAACPDCSARCPNGLNVAQRMRRAREVFA